MSDRICTCLCSPYQVIYKHRFIIKSYLHIPHLLVPHICYLLKFDLKYPGRFRFYFCWIGAARGPVCLSMCGVWNCIVSAMLLQTGRIDTGGNEVSALIQPYLMVNLTELDIDNGFSYWGERLVFIICVLGPGLDFCLGIQIVVLLSSCVCLRRCYMWYPMLDAIAMV